MSKEAFGIVTYGKCRYQIKVVEKAICLRVARKAVGAAGYSEEFAALAGRRFSGTGADRALLPPTVARRVDDALRKSIRRYPDKWRKSPVGNVAIDRPETHNLILNQGLDYLGAGTAHWGSIGTYCVLGSGTTAPDYTQTGLVSEIVRTNNTLAAGTFTTDDVPTRTRTLQRTYDFPAETSGKNYAELGLSHSGTVANNLSTRALIDGGTVAVATGQQARVVYKVIITLGANAVMTPASSTGWTAGLQGTSAFCTFGYTENMASVGQSTASLLALCAGSTIPTFGTEFTSGTIANAGTSGLNAYTTGTYKRTRWSRWELAQGVGTWRSLKISTGSAATGNAWCFVFDNAQTKDNLHTLTITWSMTYARG
jgi:hypothetical protein